MGVVSQRLRDSARGQECTFDIIHTCNHDSATVVLCHIRDDSKGMGNKANDWSAAFGCSACHEAIDRHHLTANMTAFYCLRAMQRTQRFWFENGYLAIVGEKDPKPAPRPSKILERKLSWQTKKSGQ